MNDIIVKEDRLKLIFYTMMNLILTLIIMLIIVYFYSLNIFILVFFGITLLWFLVKAMCKYGSKWIKKTPVCEFKEKEIIVNLYPQKNIGIKYKDIDEVKIIRDNNSIKLFFGGDKVTHPSGWYYVGIIYLFQKKILNEVESEIENCLKNHNIKFNTIKKSSAKGEAL